MLGRVYVAINHIESAIDAFERALEIEPNNIETLASYSQVLLMVNQAEYLTQAKVYLNQILELDPQNTGALGMLAMAATQQGDKPLAIKTWRKLQEFVPKDAPIYQSIEAQIAELSGSVQPEMASSPANATNSTDSLKPSRALVSVTITLDETLKSRLPKEGFLFVYAQDASGASRMPAAVVKMPLAELPITVDLSDSNAVMPTLTLSQLSQVRLVAKISTTGNVMQASGDLQGSLEIELNKSKTEQYTILINEELQ
nr:tetratricopeptide repeat protein [Paraglaciecola sp. 20A4]